MVPSKSAIGPVNSVVSLRDVEKTYQVGAVKVHALWNVSLEIAANRFSMLIGRTVGLEDQAARLPNQLSGGQKQRVCPLNSLSLVTSTAPIKQPA